MKTESYYIHEKITKLKSQLKNLDGEEKLIILPWDTSDASLENVVPKCKESILSLSNEDDKFFEGPFMIFNNIVKVREGHKNLISLEVCDTLCTLMFEHILEACPTLYERFLHKKNEKNFHCNFVNAFCAKRSQFMLDLEELFLSISKHHSFQLLHSRFSSGHATNIIRQGIDKLLRDHLGTQLNSSIDDYVNDIKDFVIDQIKNTSKRLSEKKGSLRYSSSILGLCYSIYARSPAAYDEIRQMGFITLPHPRTLSPYL